MCIADSILSCIRMVLFFCLLDCGMQQDQPLVYATCHALSPCAVCCRQQELVQHKEQEFALANEAMLAEFMERINHIADAVGQRELGSPDNADCAGKLRLAVDDLRDVSWHLESMHWGGSTAEHLLPHMSVVHQ